MIIKAYAKINLTLDIIGRRQDGYHILDSVFQSIGLFDELEVEKSDKISVICDGVKEDKNTAFTAAKEFFKVTGIVSGASIKIKKNIPFLSGLGGGSADAAAVIVALNKIYGAGLSSEELKKIALKCGADVPFCLTGGTARVGGIGEIISPLPDIKGVWAVIIKQGEKQSTADMYRRLDEENNAIATTNKFVDCILGGNQNAAFSHTGNAFFSLASDNNSVKALESQNPMCVSVSGSGPSHFAVFPDRNSALGASRRLKKLGFEPYTASFENCGVSIIE